MFRVRFYDRKTKESHYRNYKFKQPCEIEAIARQKGWIVARIEKEF